MAYPTFSRAHLQTLAVDASLYNSVKQIADQVVQTAMQGKTRFLVSHFSRRMTNHSIPMTVEDKTKFLSLLQERFPDCTVEYRESTRLDGTVESGIVIDWS
jgi:hypothetical protein